MSKPALYTFGGSVWAAVPELAIIELGYPVDAIEKKVINLVNGENFNPTFLKINHNATLPTLTAGGKAYTSTVEVVSYLLENAPNPPGKPFATDLVKRVHDDDIDPNFAFLLARDEEEMKARRDGIVLAYLSNRQASLHKYAPTPEASEFDEFYKAKLSGNGGILALYEGKASTGARQEFFKNSKLHWENLRKFILKELPTYLPESGFIGGDKPCEVDFHLGAWLARIVSTVGGTNIDGISGDDALNHSVPTKVKAYWETWSGRSSWKSVYADGLH